MLSTVPHIPCPLLVLTAGIRFFVKKWYVDALAPSQCAAGNTERQHYKVRSKISFRNFPTVFVLSIPLKSFYSTEEMVTGGPLQRAAF